MAASPPPTAADTVVVGAGAWGLAAALRLASDGADVVVLDDGGGPRRPTWRPACSPPGRSSRTTASTRATTPPRRGRCLAGLRARASRTPAGAASGYARSGAVYAAARPAHVGALRRLRAPVQHGGEACDWLARADSSRSSRRSARAVAGGLHLAGEHQAEPAVVRAALRRPARAAASASSPPAASALGPTASRCTTARALGAA